MEGPCSLGEWALHSRGRTFLERKVMHAGLPTEHELVEFHKGRQMANQTWKFLVLLLFLGPTENSLWLGRSISVLSWFLSTCSCQCSWEGTLGQEINDMEGTSLSKRGNSTCLPTPPRANQWCQRRGSQHHHHSESSVFSSHTAIDASGGHGSHLGALKTTDPWSVLQRFESIGLGEIWALGL